MVFLPAHTDENYSRREFRPRLRYRYTRGACIRGRAGRIRAHGRRCVRRAGRTAPFAALAGGGKTYRRTCLYRRRKHSPAPLRRSCGRLCSRRESRNGIARAAHEHATAEDLRSAAQRDRPRHPALSRYPGQRHDFRRHCPDHYSLFERLIVHDDAPRLVPREEHREFEHTSRFRRALLHRCNYGRRRACLCGMGRTEAEGASPIGNLELAVIDFGGRAHLPHAAGRRRRPGVRI